MSMENRLNPWDVHAICQDRASFVDCMVQSKINSAKVFQVKSY